MPDIVADTPITLTSDEADRVLKIQDTLIASVRAATEAHKAGAARIEQLEADKVALQSRVAELEAQIPNFVDPAVMQPELDNLAGAVAATQAAVAPRVPQIPSGTSPDTVPQG